MANLSNIITPTNVLTATSTNTVTNTNIPGAWEVYRQALRDVPQQAGFPWDVQWPDKP